MAEQLENFGHTTLNEALDASETTVTVTDGSVFPSSGDFRVRVDDEIMLVTARSTNDLTVTRGAESTSAVTHSDGADIDARLTAGGIIAAIREQSVGSGGNELDYTQKTSDTTATATAYGSATTVITGSAINVDGSTAVIVEAYFPYVELDDTQTDDYCNFLLTDGGTGIGRPIAANQNGTRTSTGTRDGVYFKYRLTPSSGSHTYDLRAWCASGAAVVKAGAASGDTTWLPGFIRVTKADADAGALGAGTTFPGSPSTGDRYRRTDLDYMVFVYDGTRWLCECPHPVVAGFADSVSATTALGYAGNIGRHKGCTTWVKEATLDFYVGGTNDGSHHWDLRLRGIDGGTTDWTDTTVDTSGAGTTTYGSASGDIGEELDASADFCYVDVVMVGSPSNLIGSATVVLHYLAT
jgi:hypothetical protein